ncbi:MAG: chorismate mutase [Candidatus Bathyarchaeota archaeon]|nr:chorismate mutase [Candidatus Bathyarchaeota archaeon]
MKNFVTIRRKIDDIDEKIVLLIKERMNLCKDIGAIKREIGIPVKDTRREDEVYLHIMAKALESGLDPQKVESIFKEIIALSVFVQGAE